MFKALIGQSPNFEALLRSTRVVATTDATVFIMGETGTGKEVLAQCIQKHSARANKPFITLNCAALPEAIAESELFGHKKGAFTGAIGNQIGRLPAAHGGTLFLDEIDSLPLALQAKLLRFLETGEIQSVGDTHTQNVDVRVIAASNAQLQERIANGTFRKDLYYRLNVVPLEIPSLRERSSDIPMLLKHFMQHFADEHKLPVASFGKSARECLDAYAWPGNIRELRNLCERLSILLAGKTIEAQNLPYEITQQASPKDSLFKLPDMGINLEAVEVDLIQQALTRTGGNRTRSAKLLGISRDTLLYRMQKHGIA